MTVKCERLLLSSRAIVQSGQVACGEVFWQTIRLEMKVPVRISSGDDYTVKPHCTDCAVRVVIEAETFPVCS